jgi:hypothetical protein
MPIFLGSKQLEHRSDEFHCRDIYFGMAYFIGQETVATGGQVIWSMSYSGGASLGVTGRKALLDIYAFLRKALLRIPEIRRIAARLRLKRANCATAMSLRETSQSSMVSSTSTC